MAARDPEERRRIARAGGLARKAKLTRRQRKNIASMGGWALRRKRWQSEQAKKASVATPPLTPTEIVSPISS